MIVHYEEPEFVTNIKKAILDQIPTAGFKRNFEHNIKFDEKKATFKVTERTLLGLCTSTYFINENFKLLSEDGQRYFDITRSIDLGECLIPVVLKVLYIKIDFKGCWK